MITPLEQAHEAALLADLIEALDKPELKPDREYAQDYLYANRRYIAATIRRLLLPRPAETGEEEVEAVATALWRHEAERVAPASTIRARTIDAFRQSGEDNRKLWMGRARAAISAIRRG